MSSWGWKGMWCTPKVICLVRLKYFCGKIKTKRIDDGRGDRKSEQNIAVDFKKISRYLSSSTKGNYQHKYFQRLSHGLCFGFREVAVVIILVNSFTPTINRKVLHVIIDAYSLTSQWFPHAFNNMEENQNPTHTWEKKELTGKYSAKS